MSRRGRPRLLCPVMRMRVTLCLRDGEDDDLAAFFAAIPSRMRAAAIKSALRSGQALTSPDNNEVVEDMGDLGDFLLGDAS